MVDGRRHGSRQKSGRAPSRTPPEESTGKEADYFASVRERAVPVFVRLQDGTEHRGVVEYYDRDLVKLVRPEGPGLLLRKTDIRYIGDVDDGSAT